MVDTLKSGFGKQQQIVNVHMQNVLQLQNHPSEGIIQVEVSSKWRYWPVSKDLWYTKRQC